MKITIDQLKQAIECLPDPEITARMQYHVIIPTNIGVIIQPTAFSHPQLITEHQLVFNIEIYKRGYVRVKHWTLDLDMYADIRRSCDDQVKSANDSCEIWKQTAIDTSNQLKLVNAQKIAIMSKWYVRFPIYFSYLIYVAKYRYNHVLSKF